MLNKIPLLLQTAYAELLDRAAAAAFNEAFADDGSFTSKTIKGRTYWYFQPSTEKGRKQRYVGPETPELLDRISRHKEVRDDQRERRTLVSTLIRSAHLPRPLPEIAGVVDALAKAGVFRLRGVLVGTVAYQTYPAMLGVRLPAAAIQTEDVDIAQFKAVSVAVEDSIGPMLEVLQKVDPTFRAIPHLHEDRVTTYEAKGGIRVDFLTPSQGPDTDVPEPLEALGTDAQPIRFLDFLIPDPEPAVVLHNSGVYVLVPAPERFAIHKLIVSRRRRAGSAKKDKDIQQAEVLLHVLAEKRPHQLRDTWKEAFDRGPKWRHLISEGLSLIDANVRDITLRTVDAIRSIIPELDLRFSAPVADYKSNRDVVVFRAEAGGFTVLCEISREALEDHFGADKLEEEGRLKKFRENREAIEQLVRTKYLSWPVEDAGRVLIKSAEVPRLRKETIKR